ncbi:protein DOG1-like 4 [Olea europaea var. sylvestris]|uniref:protein DOG1-like 4 n=1 Tax=Olea europaea var. sylvestris TaxID=158386 RepID=UPI000C1D17E8|nr:protein DOG1-like 4 [Olea europaea var. sylvestris]
MKTHVEEKFSSFFEKWMCLLEEFLQYYLRVSAENSQGVDYEVLVGKLTAHHREYYTYKWAAAHDDVLAFFAPVWLSPVENANLWVTGWKPSMAFRLIESQRKIQSPGTSLVTMTEEQVKKIEAFRVKIKMDEEKVEREFERQQVGIADRKMVELAALERRVMKDDDSAVAQVNGLVEVALKGLMGGLEKVMKMADCVRLETLKGVVETLTPMQCMDFLTAMSTVQIQMRKWGKKHDKKLQ